MPPKRHSPKISGRSDNSLRPEWCSFVGFLPRKFHDLNGFMATDSSVKADFRAWCGIQETMIVVTGVV
jgi:hypothetical protein